MKNILEGYGCGTSLNPPIMVIQVMEVYDYALKISQSFRYKVMEEE